MPKVELRFHPEDQEKLLKILQDLIAKNVIPSLTILGKEDDDEFTSETPPDLMQAYTSFFNGGNVPDNANPDLAKYFDLVREALLLVEQAEGVNIPEESKSTALRGYERIAQHFFDETYQKIFWDDEHTGPNLIEPTPEQIHTLIILPLRQAILDIFKNDLRIIPKVKHNPDKTVYFQPRGILNARTIISLILHFGLHGETPISRNKIAPRMGVSVEVINENINKALKTLNAHKNIRQIRTNPYGRSVQ